MFKRYALSGCLCILGAIGASAQKIPPVIFESIENPELQSLAVNAIFQDATGFMWFGAQTGLFQFDGYDVFSAIELDPSANWLSGVSIRAIQGDTDGNVWIVHSQGIALWNCHDSQFEDISELKDYTLFDVKQTEDSVFWAASDKGLLRFSSNFSDRTLFPYLTPENDTLTSRRTSNLYIQNNQWIWIGIDQGILRFDLKNSVYSIYNLGRNAQLSPSVLQLVGYPKQDVVIAGTSENGLFRKSANSNQFLPFNTLLPSDFGSSATIYGLQKDLSNQLWVGGRDKGVVVLDSLLQTRIHYFQQSFQVYQKSAQPVLQSLFLDNKDLAWVGTFSGVFKQRIGSPTLPLNAISDDKSIDVTGGIKSTLIDQRGFLWLGGTTEEILIQVNTVTGQVLHSERFGSRMIYFVDEDRKGFLWTTSNSGINRFNPVSHEKVEYRMPNTRTENAPTITHVLVDSRDSVWVSTSNRGVQLLHPQSKSFHHPPFINDFPELNTSYVWFVYEDLHRNYWVGTEGQGIAHYDTKIGLLNKYRHVPGDSLSLSNNRVISIAEDHNDALWIGTRHGLNRYDREKNSFTSFTTEDGLPNNEISCIVPGNDRKLWIATRSGIVQLDPDTYEIRAYDEHDGLPVLHFMFNSCSKDEEGNIYMGSEAGLFRFHPDELTTPTPEPSVKITGYTLNNDRRFPLPNTSPKTFDHDQNYLTFYFSLLDYLGLEKSKYQYRLIRNGEPGAWISSDRRNYAAFSDLSQGDYTFEVKGRDYRGLESEIASWSFTINPPAWLTSWAIGSYILAFIGLILGAYKWRVNYLLRIQQLKREAELASERTRAQMAVEMHDDVGGEATQLSKSLAKIANDETLSKTIQKRLWEEQRSAQLISQSIRGLSWIVDPERDSLQEFVSHLHKVASRAFDEDMLTFVIDRIPSEALLDVKTRQDLFRIFREALTNIHRHAQAKSVKIKIHYADTTFGFDIIDDGVGCNPEDPVQGSGRRNMKKHADSLGAQLDIESAPGKGMTLSLRYKIVKPRGKMA